MGQCVPPSFGDSQRRTSDSSPSHSFSIGSDRTLPRSRPGHANDDLSLYRSTTHSPPRLSRSRTRRRCTSALPHLHQGRVTTALRGSDPGGSARPVRGAPPAGRWRSRRAESRSRVDAGPRAAPAPARRAGRRRSTPRPSRGRDKPTGCSGLRLHIAEPINVRLLTLQHPCQAVKVLPLAKDHEMPRLLVARGGRLHPRRQPGSSGPGRQRPARPCRHARCAAYIIKVFKRIHLHVPHSLHTTNTWASVAPR